jgi:hypothetical protein
MLWGAPQAIARMLDPKVLFHHRVGVSDVLLPSGGALSELRVSKLGRRSGGPYATAFSTQPRPCVFDTWEGEQSVSYTRLCSAVFYTRHIHHSSPGSQKRKRLQDLDSAPAPRHRLRPGTHRDASAHGFVTSSSRARPGGGGAASAYTRTSSASIWGVKAPTAFACMASVTLRGPGLAAAPPAREHVPATTQGSVPSGLAILQRHGQSAQASMVGLHGCRQHSCSSSTPECHEASTWLGCMMAGTAACIGADGPKEI